MEVLEGFCNISPFLYPRVQADMREAGRRFWWAQRFKFWWEEVLLWKWNMSPEMHLMGTGIDLERQGIGIRLGLNYPQSMAARVVGG